jgi:hypothetical protein
MVRNFEVKQQKVVRFFLALFAVTAVAVEHAENVALLNSPKLRKTKAHHNGASFHQQHSKDGTGVAGLKKYHSSEQIFSLIEEAKKTCKLPMSTEWMQDPAGEGSLFVARIGHPDAKKKMLVASNEHARELLTGEVSLRFIQSACQTPPRSAFLEEASTSKSSNFKTDAQTVLENVQYVMVPVVNVKGRQLVESKTEPCQRTTAQEEGDVDLNRNMEVDWGKGHDQNWGTKPFSMYQSRILRDLASKDNYLGYIDLHTGARSLMTSWGFKPATDPDFADQKKVLDIIKQKHCPDCEIGSNRVVIGYENPGEVIDHMYATAGIKYTSLWEIYDGDTSDCIHNFNARDDEYETSVNNWSDALLSYGQYMHTSVDANERSNPGEVNGGLVEQSAERAPRGTFKAPSRQHSRLEDSKDRLLTT